MTTDVVISAARVRRGACLLPACCQVGARFLTPSGSAMVRLKYWPANRPDLWRCVTVADRGPKVRVFPYPKAKAAKTRRRR
jgi:hypothetical protein